MRTRGVRLTPAQTRVLGSLLIDGHRSAEAIGASVGLSPHLAQKVLNALTRRNLVVPVTETAYDPLPRAQKAWEENNDHRTGR